jgi:hypothetical protein
MVSDREERSRIYHTVIPVDVGVNTTIRSAGSLRGQDACPRQRTVLNGGFEKSRKRNLNALSDCFQEALQEILNS